jgi:prophage maintenance system killer protein
MARWQGETGGEVVLFEAPDGRIRVDVRLEHDTVWLTLNQIAELFGRDKSVISRHLRSVFQSDELERAAVVAKNATTAADGKTYQVDYFNLDAILSVGYRVNSKRGTQFRIWATRTLREHLLHGFTLNEQRLRERGLSEVEQAVALLGRTLTANALVTDDGRAVLDVVQQYMRAWRLLLEYDEDRLATGPQRPRVPVGELTLVEARNAVVRLRQALADRGEVTGLFGQERGDQLDAVLAAIDQTFDGEPLYPTAQARAAHLLYFLIKDHPFSDGNKRIGTLLFLEYLHRNGLLDLDDGLPRVADTTMVALALLVAESDPRQKDLMIRLVINLIEEPPA